MHRNSFYNILEDSIFSCILMQANDLVAQSGRPVTYVEVGANDGVNSSKVFPFVQHHGWNGLAIEPLPRVFESLKTHYVSYPNVKPLNLAVSQQQGKLPFFEVSDPDHPWQTMLSSFDRDVIAKQTALNPRIEEFIKEIAVEAKPLRAICEEYDLANLDVLIVDAEGFDDQVVYSLDFNKYRPLIVNVEHKHLQASKMKQLDRFLLSQGYSRMVLWADTAYVGGGLLQDESVQRCIRSMPVFMPAYDSSWGNGYWVDA